MITSVHNEQVKYVVSLHRTKGRKESGEFIIEGTRFVKEAFLRHAPIRKIYYVSEGSHSKMADITDLLALAHHKGTVTEEVSEIVMRKMSATEEPQGILALIQKKDFDWNDITIDSKTILLIIDGIQDPGNMGTILRTALAADVKQIIVTAGTVDLYNPKALRSSMGSIFSQILLIEKTTQEVVNFCREAKCNLAVSAMEGPSIFEKQLHEDYPLALVIGNEATGVNNILKQSADIKISIPMFNNVESLNAAMAAGIFLYEMRRQVQFL